MPLRSQLTKDVALIVLLAAVALVIGLVVNGQRNHPLPPSPAQLSHDERLPPIPTSSTEGPTVAEFRAFVESKRGLILDARPEEAYRAGHVPGALSLPSLNFADTYAALKPVMEANKTRPIMVYCSGFYCKAADTVRKSLEELGYTHVSVFRRGWPAWQQAELPEEKTE
jgi:rhodanese-related sulfurtransferase